MKCGEYGVYGNGDTDHENLTLMGKALYVHVGQ